MNVDLYEKLWMAMAALIIAVFITLTGVSTFAYGIRPPSHVETIEPAAVMGDPRFQQPGATIRPDGSVEARIVALKFVFLPDTLRVPAGRPVTFRITSLDVTHGFQIAGTNANAMVMPGYVSQFTYTFERPGEYLVVCNEFCGDNHHAMHARVIVEEAAP